MRARLLVRDKQWLPSGAILEITIWRVPAPVPPAAHRLNYSLFYGYPGDRIVGFDNERGKGDHMHIRGQERAYSFTTVPALIADFLEAVRSTGEAV